MRFDTESLNLFKLFSSSGVSPFYQTRNKKRKANEVVKCLRWCLPWICVLSVDVILFRLREFANKDHCLRSGRARKSGRDKRKIILNYAWKENLRQIFMALTESGERQKLRTGLLNWSKFSNSYVSNDHKQIVASVLPDTKTSLVELIATQTTGPRWWSIFITFYFYRQSICDGEKVKEKEKMKKFNWKFFIFFFRRIIPSNHKFNTRSGTSDVQLISGGVFVGRKCEKKLKNSPLMIPFEAQCFANDFNEN